MTSVKFVVRQILIEIGFSRIKLSFSGFFRLGIPIPGSGTPRRPAPKGPVGEGNAPNSGHDYFELQIQLEQIFLRSCKVIRSVTRDLLFLAWIKRAPNNSRVLGSLPDSISPVFLFSQDPIFSVSTRSQIKIEQDRTRPNKTEQDRTRPNKTESGWIFLTVKNVNVLIFLDN